MKRVSIQVQAFSGTLIYGPRGVIYVHSKAKVMSRTNKILIAAVGGAVLAAGLAAFFTTEAGKEALSKATDALTNLKGKALEMAKSNAGEIVQGATNTVGNIAKEKVTERTNGM